MRDRIEYGRPLAALSKPRYTLPREIFWGDGAGFHASNNAARYRAGGVPAKSESEHF